MNKKIYLVCHGLGEQLFLEGILNKYLSNKEYIPVKTMSPNSKVHKSSVQINNLIEVYKKSLITYREELISDVSPYIIFMVDSEERDQDKKMEESYINGKLIEELKDICKEIVGVTPKILCLYSVKGIENAIKEVYPELPPKKGVTHIKMAKPHLNIELFSQKEILTQSNLQILKQFIDDEVL